MVVHIELRLSDNAAEFGNGAAQDASLVHAAQDHTRIIAAKDRIKDQRLGGRLLADAFVQGTETARQEA